VLFSEGDARRLTARLLGLVTGQDAEVSVFSRIHAHARFAANAFQTSAHSETFSAGITVWVDGKRASAWTSDLGERALADTVAQAEALARISPVDREYVPTLGPETYRPSSRFVEATAALPLELRARQIHEALTEADRSRVTAAGFYQTEAVAGADATKHGNFRYTQSTLASLGMTARTGEGGGSGYFLRSHVDVNRLDTARVAREAVRRAVESRDAHTLPPGAYPVILEAQAVADLAGGLNFDARSTDEGRSAFSAPGGKTLVGTRVFDERLNIQSDPWHPDLPGAPFTGSGLPAAVVHAVRHGVLEQLTYSRFWAKTKGVTPTPGLVNRVMTSTAAPVGLDEMIRTTPRALLVGRFWYIRSVDPRTAAYTGLTRDGVWLIENGKIQYPVRNFRFNQSLLAMLAPGNVEAVGPSERVGSSEQQGFGAMLVPALRLKAFHFTSASDAV
jgi:predicted Zn-dependent protease